MAIEVSPNAQYVAANIVSQKYNPFDARGLRLDSKDKALLSKMLTNRARVLKNMNLLPQALRLMTTNWTELEKSEIGKKPPLVVVSSNRSKWIKQGLEAADAELKKLGIPSFNGVNDFRALKGTAAEQKSSPPIYCPKRLGNNPGRNVYIFVHFSEYDNYKTALKDSGITVVGWDFIKPSKDAKPFVGFGATRFAAIEFCKTLRQTVWDLGQVWDKAWLLDDNVVALEGVAGLEKAEDALSADKVCSGFHGADVAYTYDQIKSWYRGNNQRATPVNMPVSATQGILQQVGLWNIKYLADNFLNFPPIYITSAEDISFNRYLDLKKIGYNYYGNIDVVKELVSVHDGAGGDVGSSRQHYASLFAKRESGIPVIRPVPEPPPPYNVQYKVQNQAKQASVMQFVTTQLMVNKSEAQQHTAACQAVEQITKTALKLNIGAAYMDDDALKAAFKVNGETAQTVELFNVK